MPVIDIGDGRMVDYVEGALRAPPPPQPKPKKPWKAPKKKDGRDKSVVIRGMKFKCDPRDPNRKPAGNPNLQRSTVPHFTEWVDRRTAQTLALRAEGRSYGQAAGLTKKQAEARWAVARRKAKQDMKVIKEKIVLTDAAEEALTSALEVMRSPMSAKDKLAAAKLVLDFTMAKPAAKQDVTINTAETWLASLGKDE